MWAYFFVIGCVYFADALAVVTNVAVIYLATTETLEELKDYQIVLVLNAVIDLGCAFINGFSRPHLEIVNGLWVHVLSYPASAFPKDYRYWMVGSYSFSVAIGMMCLPLSFYYRWRLLVKDSRVSSFELTILILFVFNSSLFFLFIFGYGFYATDWQYVDKSFLHGNPFLYNKYDPNPTIVVAELRSLPMFLEAVFASVYESFEIGFILYFSIGIAREMHKMRPLMCESTKRLQNQMNLMLFMQTFFVFGTAMIPLGLLLGAMLFNSNIVGLGASITISLAFIPAINPICTLVFVTRFRKRVAWIFMCNKVGIEDSEIMSEHLNSSGINYI